MEFSLNGTGAGNTLLSTSLPAGGCIGAFGAGGGGELTAFSDCSAAAHASDLTHGWSHNAQTMQIQIASSTPDGGMLSVRSNHNGTAPSPPRPAPSGGGFLFDVVSDPTEQTNLYTTMPDKVANMNTALQAEVNKFFSNNDHFTHDCPKNGTAGTPNCACWLAKNKYGGFLGPYAMLTMDLHDRI